MSGLGVTGVLPVGACVSGVLCYSRIAPGAFLVVLASLRVPEARFSVVLAMGVLASGRAWVVFASGKRGYWAGLVYLFRKINQTCLAMRSRYAQHANIRRQNISVKGRY